MSAATTGSELLTWTAPDGRLLEIVRVVTSGRGLRASGHLVRAGVFGATYSIRTDSDGVTRRLHVQADTAEGERSLSLTRNPDGTWVRETTTGSSPMPELARAQDVYLRGSAFATSLAIRRTGLHTEPGTATGLAADVHLPSLIVDATEHHGTTVETTADGATIHYSGAYGEYDLIVDAQGFLISAEGGARRL